MNSIFRFDNTESFFKLPLRVARAKATPPRDWNPASNKMTRATPKGVDIFSPLSWLAPRAADFSVPPSLWRKAEVRLLADVSPRDKVLCGSRPKEFRQRIAHAPEMLQARFVRDLLDLVPSGPAPEPQNRGYGWSTEEGLELRSRQIIRGADWACILTPSNYGTVLAMLRAHLLDRTPDNHQKSNLHNGSVTKWVRRALRNTDLRIHRAAYELERHSDLSKKISRDLPMPVRWTFDAVAVQLLKLDAACMMSYGGELICGTLKSFQQVVTGISCATEAELPRAKALMGIAVQSLLIGDFDGSPYDPYYGKPTIASLAYLRQHLDAHPEDQAHFANRLEVMVAADGDTAFLHASAMHCLRALLGTAHYKMMATYADRLVEAFRHQHELSEAAAAQSVSDMPPIAGFSSTLLKLIMGRSYKLFQENREGYTKRAKPLTHHGALKDFATRVAAFRNAPEALLTLLDDSESTEYVFAPLRLLVANGAADIARLHSALARDPEDWQYMARAYERRRAMHPTAHVDAAVLAVLRQGSSEQVELLGQVWQRAHNPLLDLAFDDPSCMTRRRHLSHMPLVALTCYVQTRFDAVSVPESVRTMLDNTLLASYRTDFAEGRAHRAPAEAMAQRLLLANLLYHFLDGSAVSYPTEVSALDAHLASSISPCVRDDKATMDALTCLSQRAIAFDSRAEPDAQLKTWLCPLLRTFCAPGPATLSERLARLRVDIAAIPEVAQEVQCLPSFLQMRRRASPSCGRSTKPF